MHDQRIAKSVGEAERCVDRNLLALMLDDDRGLWSFDELAREFGADVEDSVTRLYGAGLIHKVDGGFVFATRAAARAHDLAEA
jgi:hypothetical protein